MTSEAHKLRIIRYLYIYNHHQSNVDRANCWWWSLSCMMFNYLADRRRALGEAAVLSGPVAPPPGQRGTQNHEQLRPWLVD